VVPENALSCPHCGEGLVSTKIIHKPPSESLKESPAGALPPNPFARGALLGGRYQILYKLGEGGMGKVFLTWDREIDEYRAIKVLPPQTADDLLAIAHLKEEAKLAMALSHPNIVRLYNYERHQDLHFLVMEYVNGLDLRTYLSVRHRLAQEEVKRIGLEIAYALKASHGLNIIHRDIKPANILLELKTLDVQKIKEQGDELDPKDVPDLTGARVRLTDFGIAQSLKESLSRTTQVDTSGTLTYMSPEQVRGKGIDHLCDLYALGVTMYELLKGYPPFQGESMTYQILHEPPEPLPGIDPHLNEIILSLLEKEKSRRPQSAGLLIRELKVETADSTVTVPMGEAVERPQPAALSRPVPDETPGPLRSGLRKRGREGLAFLSKAVQRIGKREIIGVSLLAALVVLGMLLFEKAKTRPSTGLISFWGMKVTQGWKSPYHKDPVTGMEFVLVKGGCYSMGDAYGDGNSDEAPVHRVCVDPFYMSRYEVTQGQWTPVMGYNPSWFKYGDRYPVERVSWEDVQEFIRILNQKTGIRYRLPTEAEWEYAARGGEKGERYPGTGNESQLNEFGWFVINSNQVTQQVGILKPNGLGLYDLAGNVWEWVEDWYDAQYYQRSPRYNPPGPSLGNYKVLRGGSVEFGSWYLRTSVRGRDIPSRRYGNIGFRLVLPVS
jgi:formylglycine-generating enzyme required for sulfatase activity/serine/threonine protein kinase